MKTPRTQQGQSWAVKMRKTAPNAPAFSSSKGKQGKGNPQQDAVDRLGMAMKSGL